MRIWSVHPRFLDSKGLVACWRETLLAKHVLEGKTKGYKNHPQLIRFKNCDYSLGVINSYLYYLFLESERRGFNFDISKFERVCKDYSGLIFLNRDQLLFEFEHLYKKILFRSPSELSFSLEELEKLSLLDLQSFSHPLFVLIEGRVESWEIV
ncbi:pyrimidine dimer DNA glycosylase/endonuclease V [Candidatus Woesearchaeota archaeon]|nr:pyrimidine dimer DNA glycosylase/endonuclease V [Candidatus Woesearchaeota archaeon]